MLKSITLEVVGEQKLACEGCEQRVEHALKEQAGVQKARASARNQRIEILFDTAKLDAVVIAERIRKLGYETKTVS